MKQSSKLAPIVLFVFNRPWHTAQTLVSLAHNNLAKKSDLIIFSDGPKTSNDISKVMKVRKYIKGLKGFKSIKVIEQQKNIGLALSIINGVSKVINQHEKVIVMEDDIVTSPYFLTYMNDALDFYNHQEKVMHISGYMYPINNNKKLENTFFLKPATCWGWATWKRAWKHFNKDANFLLETFSKKNIYEFNLNGGFDYFKQVKQNKNGRKNTWAVFWYASIFIQKGLSLHPFQSFVSNIGHDGRGIHCTESNNFDVELNKNYPILFSNKIEESVSAKKALIEYFRKTKTSFLVKVLKKIHKLTLTS
jgi:hypothetical protein